MNELIVRSPSFKDGEEIPLKHTGYADDISPELDLENLEENTVSLAVIMDDLSIPFSESYNHWVLFNLPKTSVIPENIPHGEKLKEFSNAVQGIGYGKHCYRGPKIPPIFNKPHTYVFTVYALDKYLNSDASATKKDLLKEMEGHIVNKGKIACYCNVIKKAKRITP